jgi:hypothetical protein
MNEMCDLCIDGVDYIDRGYEEEVPVPKVSRIPYEQVPFSNRHDQQWFFEF